MRKKEGIKKAHLNVLLSNGRFPVTLDLARQLRLDGHRVFAVDAMHYHVCRFSKHVKRSYHIPAPRDDAKGYIDGVMQAIRENDIDLVIPMHEEIFYLAEEAQTNPELRSKLLSPPFHTLIMLHNKWEFSQFLLQNSLGVPHSSLCKSYEDVLALDRDAEWALKPVYGRANTSVFHLEPGEPLPTEEEMDISDDQHYVAQEWVKGQRFCTYSVLWNGKVSSLSVYPVRDTIDGSSCVYFESTVNPMITEYVERLSSCLPGVSGQVALDVIENDNGDVVAIECNPRATSGIHLYSSTKRLARVLTCHIPVDAPWTEPEPVRVEPPNHAKRKVAPGMLMWKRSHADNHYKAVAIEYLNHMKRLIFSRDVMWSWTDLTPSLMQPFLLTSYYEICREKNLKLPTMFQHDYVWEPRGEHLAQVRKMFGHDPEKEDGTAVDERGSFQ